VLIRGIVDRSGTEPSDFFLNLLPVEASCMAVAERPGEVLACCAKVVGPTRFDIDGTL